MKQESRFKPNEWALVLGASSGFGGATAVEFAKAGLNIALSVAACVFATWLGVIMTRQL